MATFKIRRYSVLAVLRQPAAIGDVAEAFLLGPLVTHSIAGAFADSRSHWLTAVMILITRRPQFS